MNTDILKMLFVELFNVNHLMYDLMNLFEDTDIGDEKLTNFYISHITSEFSKHELMLHRRDDSASCLGLLTYEQADKFLDEMFACVS